jgi:hypothetical protein
VIIDKQCKNNRNAQNLVSRLESFLQLSNQPYMSLSQIVIKVQIKRIMMITILVRKMTKMRKMNKLLINKIKSQEYILL